jgi:aminoglycoside 3'-phosphotransferase-1
MGEADRQELGAAISLPAGLSAELAGYLWSRDLVGASDSDVYRLHGKANAADLFLKHGRNDAADDLTDEMARLLWLGRHMPVPAAIHFVRTKDEAWLLTAALPGQTARQALEANPAARPALVDALAAFLRRFHAIPVSECPFNGGHIHRLARARARIDAGLVDLADFDAERKGWTAEQVWDALHALLPLAADAVVTHGDFSLDNLLVHDGEVVGCVDVARAGIADRYQDLAILWNGLGDVEPSLQDRLLRQYGIAEVDRRKLSFHLLLDELF